VAGGEASEQYSLLPDAKGPDYLESYRRELRMESSAACQKSLNIFIIRGRYYFSPSVTVQHGAPHAGEYRHSRFGISQRLTVSHLFTHHPIFFYRGHPNPC